MMVGLPSTLGSAILHTTLRCAGMLFRQAESMFINTLMTVCGRAAWYGCMWGGSLLHYTASLWGTRQYWFNKRSQLIAMVDKFGLPTIFITHSVADLQWPELATPHLPWWPWMQFQPQQRCITVIAQVPGIYGFSKQTYTLGLRPWTQCVYRHKSPCYNNNIILCNSCNFQ